MSTRRIARIAVMAAVMVTVFHLFSQILYLEAITLTIAVLSAVVQRRDVVMAAMVFALVNMMIQGISLWTMAYLLVYPGYAMLLGWMKPVLLRHRWLAVVMVGLCSFATGQLLDLPFILLDARVTMIYVLMGLKTSLLQGMLSALEALFLFDPLVDRLQRIERNYR